VDSDDLQALYDAVRHHWQLRIRYWTASRDQETDRVVDFYRLLNVDGMYYLVGYCHLREAMRIFSPSRIRAWQPTGRVFVPPEGFDLDDFLQGAFAVFRGDDETVHAVSLRFRGNAVRYVRERLWHRSQTIDEQADGGLTLRFNLSHLREIERFALSWGGDCEVLEPLELRRRVADETARAAKRYRPT
jgi:predicted DNA-binding transcriptional regulator YafY